MQAYEFYAIPQNGKIIIPEKYIKYITAGVKVIILDENSSIINEEETSIQRKSDLLLEPFMDTKGWKFNREEANER